MGQSQQAMNDLVLATRQRFNLKAPALTDSDRARVESVTIIETINGQITIDRRTTKEGSYDHNRDN